MSQRDLEREARMIAMRNDGATLKAIGAEFGVTGERVRQVLSRAGVDTSRKLLRATWTCAGCDETRELRPSEAAWRIHCSKDCWKRTIVRRNLSLDQPKQVYPSGLVQNQFPGGSGITLHRWWAQKWLQRPLDSREWVTRIDPDKPITPDNLFVGTPSEALALRRGAWERDDLDQIRADYRNRSVATMMNGAVR